MPAVCVGGSPASSDTEVTLKSGVSNTCSHSFAVFVSLHPIVASAKSPAATCVQCW